MVAPARTADGLGGRCARRRACRPTRVRIVSMTGASRMAAMIFSSPLSRRPEMTLDGRHRQFAVGAGSCRPIWRKPNGRCSTRQTPDLDPSEPYAAANSFPGSGRSPRNRPAKGGLASTYAKRSGMRSTAHLRPMTPVLKVVHRVIARHLFGQAGPRANEGSRAFRGRSRRSAAAGSRGQGCRTPGRLRWALAGSCSSRSLTPCAGVICDTHACPASKLQAFDGAAAAGRMQRKAHGVSLNETSAPAPSPAPPGAPPPRHRSRHLPAADPPAPAGARQTAAAHGCGRRPAARSVRGRSRCG